MDIRNGQLFSELKQGLIARGADIVSSGDIRSLSREVRQGMPVGICIGVALDPAVIEYIIDAPTAAYAVEYTEKNDLLDALGQYCAAFLIKHDHRVIPQKASVDQYDKSTLSTLLPHKTVATLSGMGWIGRNACLITADYGSAVRITSVLTDAPLSLSIPVQSSECGDCSKCLEACPGSAIKGSIWQHGTERDDLYDAFACRETIMRVSEEAGIPKRICGICIAACPFTKRYLKRGELRS